MFLFLFCIAINISFAGSESDFEFTSYTDKKIGKYIVITKYTGNSAKCEIPEKIGNYPVLEIYCGDSLFAPKNKITELILPNSLKKIGANAFKNNHLTKLDFPSNVDYITVKSISIPKSIGIGENGKVLKQFHGAEWCTPNMTIDEIKYEKGGKMHICARLKAKITSLQKLELEDDGITVYEVPDNAHWYFGEHGEPVGAYTESRR